VRDGLMRYMQWMAGGGENTERMQSDFLAGVIVPSLDMAQSKSHWLFMEIQALARWYLPECWAQNG